MTDRDATVRTMLALRRLSDEGVRWLASHVEDVRFEAGERLIVEGSRDRDCFFIVEGTTRAEHAGMLLGGGRPGDPQGELGLFLATPRAATVTARSAVTALRLRAEDYDELRRSDPELAEHIRVEVCTYMARRLGFHEYGGVSIDV